MKPIFFAWQVAFLGMMLVIVGGLPSIARAATPAEVDNALAKGKAILYDKMQFNNWETSPKRNEKEPRFSSTGGQWGGPTAIAIYALLAAGEDPNSPKLAPAIKWLKNADIIGTYALAMRCQVWLMLPRTPETKKLADTDMSRLQGGFDSVPRTAGFSLYNYLTTKGDHGMVDHSVSQFGVLAMWACAQLGSEVPTQYWKDVEKRWAYDQQDDGGWFYAAAPNGAPEHSSEQASMTAAGVATLYITQDYVHAEEGLKCNGNLKNDHIDKGVQWMANHTSEWTPDFGWWGGKQLPGYTLYGVERIGVASGLKYFGSVDWYQFGADWCIKNQAENGSWGGDDNFANTAFCMLFLARGRAPVLINKMKYDTAGGPEAGKEAPWNQRPRDVANFVRWMGTQTERQHDINWQISNLDISEADFHDAPFLYFSGNKAIYLKPEQIDKLKLYIQHGGMVLFNSDCGNERDSQNPFVRSVIDLGKQMFPDYEFRDLPDNNVIFTNQQYPASRWKKKLTMKALSNGVREMMVLLPGDPARTWQLQQSSGSGVESYQPLADLILYGTDKEPLRVKGQSFLITPDPAITATKTIKIARLKYNRNWNPEPGGWDRLAAIMHNQAKVDLAIETVELTDKPITGYPIAHLTGTTALAFTPGQMQQLKNFVEKGGTLIVDDAGGNEFFPQSAEDLLNKLFHPGLPNDPLLETDPVFQIGFPKGKIRYREYAKRILGTTRTPQLKAISVSGRNAVYYSRYDLTGGLVGEPIDGITGYDVDSSSLIMSGIIMSVAH